ncbi:MAG: DUF4307 domain-containing protein [Galactobacter sp.]
MTSSATPTGTQSESAEPSEHQASLASRYGRPKRHLSKRTAIVLAAVALVLSLVVVYFLTRNQHASYDTENIAFDVVSSRQMDVTVAVKLPAEDSVTCGIQVLAEDHAVVGYAEETFTGADGRDAGGGQREVQRTVPIRTVFEGVTGQISICWTN